MRVRHFNRGRPLRGWLVLGMGLGAATLCGVPACNAILGNEAGHCVATGCLDGTAASSGTGTSEAGDSTGGSPSGGSPAGGSPSGGSPAGGSPAGGSPSGGSPTGHAGASSAGAGHGGASNGGASNGGASNGGASNGGASNGGAAGKAGAGGTAGVGGGTDSPYCPGTVVECGGNLLGTWVTQSTCLMLPSPDPTIPTECQGGDMYQRYKITGNVTYMATTWTEDYTQDSLETLDYTSSCITAFHKADSLFPAPASALTCSMIASNLSSNGASSASCPFLNNGCLCALTFTARGSTGDTYAKIGNSEYLNDKDEGHPTSYCVKTINGVVTLTTSVQTTSDYTFERVLTLSSR